MNAGRRARRDAGRVRVPVMLFQAGLDEVVRPEAQEHACRCMPDCELRLFPTARHEILVESDDIRDEAVRRILGFLEKIAVQAEEPGSHGAGRDSTHS